MFNSMMFKDRTEAAHMLAEKLKKYKKDGVVVALPRGGVPLGYIIAQELGLPLDIILSKKIGYPFNKEFAIGSVSLQGRIINEDIPVTREYIEEETARIRKSLKEKYKLYMGDRLPINPKNKNVIIVDDGIATGNTMLATIELIKKSNPGRIIVATPVAPPDSIQKISEEVDEVVCLSSPEFFIGVSQFYENFEQVNDETVIQLLKKSNNRKLETQIR